MTPIRWKMATGAALLALCTYAAYGQADAPPPPPDGQNGPPPMQSERAQGPERELKNLTRILSLTAEQQASIKPLLEQQTTEMRAVRAKADGAGTGNPTPESRASMRAQAEQIREATDTKISALLDDTQKPKFTQWVERRKAEMARRQSRGGDTPPPPPAGPDGGPGGPPNEN